jgi:predicted PurR-regulated permease PerM
MRAFLCLVGLYAAGLVGFYGLYFGVPYFLSRFLFPLSAFLALVWSGAALDVWRRLRRRIPRVVCWIVPILLVGYLIVLSGLIYAASTPDRFFRGVRHLEARVPQEAWIGGFQTGIVGYFRDRTINLDGKVNPEALRARLDGRLSLYIVNSPIDYVFGWEGIAGAIQTPVMAEHFVPDFHDPSDDFGLLRRRSRPPR